MKLSAQDLPVAQLHTFAADVLAIPMFEDEGGGPALATLNQKLEGLLERALAEEDVKGKRGQSLLIHTHGKLASNRLLVVGVGKRAEVTEEVLRRMGGQVSRTADKARGKALGVVLPEVRVDAVAGLQAAAEGALLGLYRFNRYLTKDRQEQVTQGITLLAAAPSADAEAALQRAEKIAGGVALARDLVNEPPSTLNPSELASRAKAAATAAGLAVEVHGPDMLVKENMELMLAVSRASAEEPRLVRMEYVPAGRPVKKVVLVGKGLTFDSGGLDLKTAEGMLDMKVDMAGSAAVLGAMLGVAATRPNVHVVGYMGCVENMVGGRAFKPGDIIKSRAGITVEIGNTDAEGRLVLADVLSYAQDREKPDLVVDLATLTGACMVALGPYMAGLMSNQDELAQKLASAAEAVGEDYWRLPLSEPLKEMIKSPIADLKNVGQRYGGAITAGLFLRDFIKDGVGWAHLDIAGPATWDKDRDYVSKGGTGFGVRTLVRWLQNLG